ncbi:MAG: hypothetical protein ACU85V_00240 [Gammaproteobacteria bacterium]
MVDTEFYRGFMQFHADGWMTRGESLDAPSDAQIAVVGLGVAGEAGEVAEQVRVLSIVSDGAGGSYIGDRVRLELGDVMAYVAMLCRYYRIDIGGVVRMAQAARPGFERRSDLALSLCASAGSVAERIKKHLRGDGAVDRPALRTELVAVVCYVIALARTWDARLIDICHANMEKIGNRRAARADANK